jgi:hypothetical protein
VLQKRFRPLSFAQTFTMLNSKLGLPVDKVWLEEVWLEEVSRRRSLAGALSQEVSQLLNWGEHDSDGSGLLDADEWVKLVNAVRREVAGTPHCSPRASTMIVRSQRPPRPHRSRHCRPVAL